MQLQLKTHVKVNHIAYRLPCYDLNTGMGNHYELRHVVVIITEVSAATFALFSTAADKHATPRKVCVQSFKKPIGGPRKQIHVRATKRLFFVVIKPGG